MGVRRTGIEDCDDEKAAAAPKGFARRSRRTDPNAVPPDAASDSRALGRSDGTGVIVGVTVKLRGIVTPSGKVARCGGMGKKVGRRGWVFQRYGGLVRFPAPGQRLVCTSRTIFSLSPSTETNRPAQPA